MKVRLIFMVAASAVLLVACGTPYSAEPITDYHSTQNWKAATECLGTAFLLQPVHIVTEADAKARTANVYLNNPDERHVGVIVVSQTGARTSTMSAQTLEAYEPVAAASAKSCQRG